MRFVFSFLFALILLLVGLAAWIGLTPWGAKAVVRELARLTLGARTVSWSAMEGSLIGGIRVDQLEIRVIPFLPEASFLRLQSLSVRATALAFDGLEVGVINGRLFHPGDDPIVFNARLKGRDIAGNVYARGLDLGNVRGVLTQFLDVPPFKGAVRDIDLFISGRLDRPDVKGHFLVERIVQNDFVLQEVRARADLHFMRGIPRWETRGRLFLDSGYFRSPVALIVLNPSVLTFTGRPSRPELDIRATSRIARTRIAMTVKGTRAAPEVLLSSEPSYSREQLLLMLATGKRWTGVVEGAVDKGKPSSVLTGNFVDYLLFGGDRVKIIRAIGLSDVSFNADDKKQGVTFSKELTERLGVGYGVQMGTNTQRQRELTQRLEGEYQLTDHFLLGAQKEMRPGRAGGTMEASGYAEPGTKITTEDLPDDRVFLKYRSAF